MRTIYINVLGSSGSGKSSWLSRVQDNIFSEFVICENIVRTMKIQDERIKFDLHISGFEDRLQTFYRSPHAFIWMYDMTQPLDRMETLSRISEFSRSSLFFIVVGTKSDDPKAEEAALPFEIPHFTVSSKTGENVYLPLYYIADKV